MTCAHCGSDSVNRHGYHVCEDNRPWTQTERDLRDADLRRRYPAVPTTPTFQSERMGRHNRRSR